MDEKCIVFSDQDMRNSARYITAELEAAFDRFIRMVTTDRDGYAARLDESILI